MILSSPEAARAAFEPTAVAGFDREPAASAHYSRPMKTQAQPDSLRVVYTGGEHDPRTEIPVLGFKDYWYPMIPVNKIRKRKPTRVRLLGVDLCIFRGKSGPAVISDVCPHRGVSLSDGDCHFAGTVSCPYHGWTFDEGGAVVGILSEGPDSPAAGRAQVRTYPTAVIRGQVFVWMGDGPPTRPQDDLPPEFFDESCISLTNRRTWKTNWRQALENMNDNHVFYTHINSVQVLLRPLPKISFKGAKPYITGSGITLSHYSDDTLNTRPYQEEYPGLGLWPKHRYRLTWTWLFKHPPLNWIPNLSKGRYQTSSDAAKFNQGTEAFEREWNQGPNMPGMMRINMGDLLFTRWCVPVEDRLTRLYYFYTTRPRHKFSELWIRAIKHPFIYKLLHDRNLGQQDGDILENARYDMPERMTAFDIETLAWRRLAILSSRYGGRHDLIPQERIDRINGVSRDPETSADPMPETPAGVPPDQTSKEVPVAVG